MTTHSMDLNKHQDVNALPAMIQTGPGPVSRAWYPKMCELQRSVPCQFRTNIIFSAPNHTHRMKCKFNTPWRNIYLDVMPKEEWSLTRSFVTIFKGAIASPIANNLTWMSVEFLSFGRSRHCQLTCCYNKQPKHHFVTRFFEAFAKTLSKLADIKRQNIIIRAHEWQPLFIQVLNVLPRRR